MKALTTTILALLVSLPLLAAPPTPPGSISARTTSAGYVEINWSRATDSDGTIAGYEVIRNDTIIPVGNVTQYIDSNVSNGVNYTYRIAAVDNTGERSVGNSSVSVTVSGSGNNINVGTTSLPDVQPTVQQAEQPTAQSTEQPTVQRESALEILHCIDSDGDGWGWDGYASCLIEQITSSTGLSVCIDSDGDGWGWDGYESCIVNAINNGTAAVSVCIDIDGDGWGWTGSESCKIEFDTKQHNIH